MAYRDERETLQARVDELQSEVAEAKGTIARLRGETTKQPQSAGEVDPKTGMPFVLRLERELPFEVSDEGLVAISQLLDVRMPGGTVSQVGNTLRYQRGGFELLITRTADRTHIRLTSNDRAALETASAPGLVLGFFGTMIAGVALELGLLWIAIGMVLGALLGGWLSARASRRLVVRQRPHVKASFGQVLDVAESHRKPSTRRIAAHNAEPDVLAEQDALADETALRRDKA